MSHCMRHYEEPQVALCRTCNKPFCSRCLVFSFGPNKPPFCVGCALAASGVRNNMKTVIAPPPPPPSAERKAEKLQRKAEKAEAKAMQKLVKRNAKHGVQPEPVAEAARSSSVPAPNGISTPASRFASPTATHPAG